MLPATRAEIEQRKQEIEDQLDTLAGERIALDKRVEQIMDAINDLVEELDELTEDNGV